ncbi:hypothetical protein C8R44DRAFT_862282 [Mycena epipterygia]|nr:hypothetical protein C8R44DRAFT_862282 [Mycena epipterygia]
MPQIDIQREWMNWLHMSELTAEDNVWTMSSEAKDCLSAREHLVGDRLMDVRPYARCPASFLQIFALLDPARHNLHQPIHCPFAFLCRLPPLRATPRGGCCSLAVLFLNGILSDPVSPTDSNKNSTREHSPWVLILVYKQLCFEGLAYAGFAVNRPENAAVLLAHVFILIRDLYCSVIQPRVPSSSSSSAARPVAAKATMSSPSASVSTCKSQMVEPERIRCPIV